MQESSINQQESQEMENCLQHTYQSKKQNTHS